MNIKTIGQAGLVFLLTAVCAILLLFGTACIPQTAIEEQVKSSAGYFQEKSLFPYLNHNQFNCRQDNYADSILVNIMYHVGQGQDENLFSSVMYAAYYNEEMQAVNESLAIAVESPQTANVPYFRYWHGSLALLRPLFLVTDIVGARLVLGIAALLSMILTSLLLWKRKQRALAVCFFVCYLLVNGLMGLFCIEYVMMLLLAGIVCFYLVLTYREEVAAEVRRKQVFLTMVITGALACFFDFLTTETLTLTLPLFLEFALEQNASSMNTQRISTTKQTSVFRDELQQLFVCGLGWGFAYAGMFLVKWGISACLFGRKAFMAALSSASERIGGTVHLGDTNLDPEASVWQRLTGALSRNISALFPFRDEMNLAAGVLWFCLALLLCFSVIYLLHTKELSFDKIGIFLLLGVLPYLRYLALSNHSYMHYFFTYRAQMVTVLAAFYLTWEYGLKNLKKQNPGKQNLRKPRK
ncbi:MAG TPA: hypothetical protein VJZ01_05005 [Lachnospiraceae bacterium]|nr:hypothetical protein [Lachnospiraceae bacterium]